MNTPAASPIIVVGADGSPNSVAACEWASRYAAATGRRLRIVTAWAWPRMYGMPMMVDGWNPRADALNIVEAAAARLSLPADRVETRVEEGRTSDALVGACEGADLMVLGAHGHGIGSVLLGSVSNDCLHHATVPVVIVPDASKPNPNRCSSREEASGARVVESRA